MKLIQKKIIYLIYLYLIFFQQPINAENINDIKGIIDIIFNSGSGYIISKGLLKNSSEKSIIGKFSWFSTLNDLACKYFKKIQTSKIGIILFTFFIIGN